ncbi:MAG: DUF1540 domain-containing protein [Bifidobacteriaceae bacterium]|jgi:hypothetical protein|nr:DUF1540 domain-containing protein [Bifidobacteriaceae bacterium]
MLPIDYEETTMLTLDEMSKVAECSVTGCAYNQVEACHAGAVTIAGPSGRAGCATFIPLTVKGGFDQAQAAVGACQHLECAHNADLECAAPAIQVGLGGSTAADCLTFAPAAA